jgi:hypothetical protein
LVQLDLPWTFLQTTAIGFWTTDASYPGRERAAVSEGFFFFNDACAGQAGPGLFLDMMYGAVTVQGYTPLPLEGDFLNDRFLDLASNYSNNLNLAPPYVGNVMETRHLIYVNLSAD